MPLPLATLDQMYAVLICRVTWAGRVCKFTVFVLLRQPFFFWRSHVLDCLLASLDLMNVLTS